MKKIDYRKRVAYIQVILGIILFLTSVIGTYYIVGVHYYSFDNGGYDDKGNPKGLFISVVNNFIQEYSLYSDIEKKSYIDSLGYTEVEYYSLNNEILEPLEEDYSGQQGAREALEVVSTVLMFGFIGRSFLLVFIVLGFIASLISVILISMGTHNYYKN